MKKKEKRTKIDLLAFKYVLDLCPKVILLTVLIGVSVRMLKNLVFRVNLISRISKYVEFT